MRSGCAAGAGTATAGGRAGAGAGALVGAAVFAGAARLVLVRFFTARLAGRRAGRFAVFLAAFFAGRFLAVRRLVDRLVERFAAFLAVRFFAGFRALGRFVVAFRALGRFFAALRGAAFLVALRFVVDRFFAALVAGRRAVRFGAALRFVALRFVGIDRPPRIWSIWTAGYSAATLEAVTDTAPRCGKSCHDIRPNGWNIVLAPRPDLGRGGYAPGVEQPNDPKGGGRCRGRLRRRGTGGDGACGVDQWWRNPAAE